MTPEIFHSQALTLARQNRMAEALVLFDKVLQLKPTDAEALANRGAVLLQMGRLDEAIASFDRVLLLHPDEAGTHFNRANALLQLRRVDQALAGYDNALKYAPDHVETLMNRGFALMQLRRPDDALRNYDRAVQVRPDYVDAWYTRGLVLNELNRLEDAVASFDQALRLKPDHAGAHNDRGNALLRLHRLAEAVADYDRAVQLRPDFSQAWFNRGTALMKLNRVAEAIPNLDRAVRLKPDNRPALVLKAYLQAKICDWTSGALPPGADLDAEPFLMLGMDDDPARQLVRAQNWARANFPTTPSYPPKTGTASGKLRVGYFSADFHDHPVMHLMARLFELHDRERFEVHLFSFGPDRQDAMRQRAVKAADRFHDVAAMSDAGILALAREAGIDIAINLMGYTRGARTEIFARRIAPVQVNYLGYAGTMGASFMDHIIADPWVAPEADSRFYAEKVLRLPNSFMATDNGRAAAEDRFTRSHFGLPEDGIVFCCFNNGYKITPAEFGIWMRLLQKVPGSVAWLTRDSEDAAANLVREAMARGIDKSRLVFAERMPEHGDYLARYRCADIFLDTFNYNAHATAADVLWAGLPLITRSGRSFPSRVAGSLLGAIGLPELVTQTAEDYEALALALATQPQRLADIKARLAANRGSTPLFDSQGFTRDFERLLESIRA